MKRWLMWNVTYVAIFLFPIRENIIIEIYRKKWRLNVQNVALMYIIDKRRVKSGLKR